MQVDRASRPFRWFLKKFLRRQQCQTCGAALEIVWIRTPPETGFSIGGNGIGWDNQPGESVSVGYRCTACSELLSWRGRTLVTTDSTGTGH